MTRILDFYFRFPIIMDYLTGLGLVSIIRYYINANILLIPKDDVILDYASETTTVLLTLAGFILTFLTLLITFKTGPADNTRPQSLMESFCRSSLYKDTTKLLKNCIKSLIFLSLMIYILRFINIVGIFTLYYWVIFCVIVLLLTILRALFILDKILKFHTD